jgi:hypothetical protein
MKKLALRLYNLDRQFFKAILVLGLIWAVCWLFGRIHP